MKKGLHIFFILYLTGLASCVTDNEPAPTELVQAGDAVPAFSVLDSDGAKVDFVASDFSGKRILIVFFSTTCPDCQRELPKIQAAWEAIGTEGLELIAVARGQDAETVSEYWAKAGFTMPWYTDPDRSAYSKFATTTIPRLYLTDDGIVKWKAIENLDDMGIHTGSDLTAKIIETVGPFNGLVYVGDTVPTFTVENSGGTQETFSTQDFTGKKSLIVFFTTACPDCRHEMPKVQAAWTALKSGGFQVIPVGRAESPANVQAYWNNTDGGKIVFDMPWYVDPDRSAYSKFATRTVPRFYLVNGSGTVVWKAVENLDKLGITTGEQLIAKINTF